MGTGAPFNSLKFSEYKARQQKIVMLTAYDAWQGRLAHEAGADCLLVGDSVAMVVHGHPDTLHADSSMIALHTAAVRRGAPQAFIVADMPFLSPRRSIERALDDVGLFMRAGANAVKIEGCWGQEAVIEAIVQSGVPVLGHIGLTPQSINAFGGFKIQGRTASQAEDIAAQAMRLQELGCVCVVIECVPTALATQITESLAIPTIGIGAGLHTDGQVLVFHDVVGLYEGFKPKFVKRYIEGASVLREGLKQYVTEVRSGCFPDAERSFEVHGSV